MKHATSALVAALMWTATPAFAWDGPDAWYRGAEADNPGSGGIMGTGGAHDHGITCRECHTERKDEPSLALQFAFTPALSSSSGMSTYIPGQRYRVAVNLANAALGPPCGEYLTHTDGFGAAFEDANGAAVGILETDSGEIASSCPSTAPISTTAGTTGLYGDCKVIFAKGKENISAWTFYWTAPATGTVRMFYGGVDGDCDMMSKGDAVVVGSMTLKNPTFAQASPPAGSNGSRWQLASSVSVIAMLGVAIPLRRRRRR